MPIQLNSDQNGSNLVQFCQIQIKSCQIQSNLSKELDLGLTGFGFGVFLVRNIVVLTDSECEIGQKFCFYISKVLDILICSWSI